MYPFGNRKSGHPRAVWLAGAALALGGASAARAQTQTFTFSSDLSGSQVVTLSQNGGQTASQVYAGRYKGQLGAGAATNIFCVDAGHEIAVGDTYAANTQHNITGSAGALNGGYYGGGLASALTDGDIAAVTLTQASGRASEVAYLADTYLNANSFSGASGSADTGLNLTGLGLSVWDILQDGGDGLTAGQLRTGASDAAAYGGLVGYYEGVAAAHTGYTSQTAGWVQAPQQAGAGTCRTSSTRGRACPPDRRPCQSRALLPSCSAWASSRAASGCADGGGPRLTAVVLCDRRGEPCVRPFSCPVDLPVFLLAQKPSKNLSNCQVCRHKPWGISLHSRAGH